MANRICTIEGCGRPHSARGWCVHHYGKWRRIGDPLHRTPTLLERFRAKVDLAGPTPSQKPSLGPCWTWLAYIDEDGYGKSWDGNQVTFAHRVSYRMFTGPIPDGCEIDHLCRNRSCVNPMHLEAVSPRINNLRSESVSSKNARKEACAVGHPFDAENTYLRPDGTGRDCRKCREIVEARRRGKRKNKKR